MRARDARRLPAAVAARPRLPEGRHDHYVQFRAALSSTPYDPAPADVAASAPPPVRAFDAAELAPGEPSVEERVGPALSGRSELQVLVDRLAEGREPVHQVWVAPLADAEPLDAVLGGPPWWKREQRALGLAADDRPPRPPRRAAHRVRSQLDLAGSGGHVAVVGAPRTGKSTLLRTLAAVADARATRPTGCSSTASTWAAACSARSRAPRTSAASPASSTARRSSASCASSGPSSRIARRCSASAAGRACATPAPTARACRTSSCSIDGWEAFKREFEGLDRELEELAAAGLRFGIHLVGQPPTAGRRSARRCSTTSARGSSCGSTTRSTRWSRARPPTRCPAGIPGRGLTMGGLLLPGRAAAGRRAWRPTRATGDALGEHRRAGRRALERRAPPSRIRLLPRAARRRPGPAAVDPRGGRRDRGRGARPASPCALRPARRRPALPRLRRRRDGQVVAAARRRPRAGSRRTPRGAAADDRRRAPLARSTSPRTRTCAPTRPTRWPRRRPRGAAHASSGRGCRGRRVAAGRRRRGAGRATSSCSTTTTSVAGPTGGPLAPLLDLLAVGARRRPARACSARRVGGTARGAYEAVFGRLRELGSPGLLLSGDPGEGPLLSGHQGQRRSRPAAGCWSAAASAHCSSRPPSHRPAARPARQR